MTDNVAVVVGDRLGLGGPVQLQPTTAATVVFSLDFRRKRRLVAAVLRDTLVSCLMINVVDVLVADGASLGIVHDHVLFGSAEIRVVLHVELGHLQRVLLSLDVNCAIHSVGMSHS